MTFHLPLAAFGEIVGLLFLIISFIVWVVNQANSQKIKQLNQKQKPQPPRGQMPGAPMQGGPMQGGPMQGQMPRGQRPMGQGGMGQGGMGQGGIGQGGMGQGFGGAAGQAAKRPQNPELAIEEFLRRAAQQQQQQTQPQTQRPAPGRPASLTQRPTAQQAAHQAHLEEEAIYGKDVASYEQSRGVEAHLRQSMQGRVGHSDLTDLDEVDEQLQARLHATFDHQVGTISAAPVTSPSSQQSAAATSAVTRRNVSAAAAGVAAMLSDRRNLASAIVLQEILKRPEI